MKMPILALLLLSFSLLNPHLVIAKTPKQMTDNVLSLTEAAAALKVCMDSKEYQRLSNEAALTT